MFIAACFDGLGKHTVFSLVHLRVVLSGLQIAATVGCLNHAGVIGREFAAHVDLGC